MKTKTIVKLAVVGAIAGYVMNLIGCLYISESYKREDLIKPVREQCQTITQEIKNINDLRTKYHRYLIEDQKTALEQRIEILSGMQLKLETDVDRYTKVIEDWKKKAVNPLNYFK